MGFPSLLSSYHSFKNGLSLHSKKTISNADSYAFFLYFSTLIKPLDIGGLFMSTISVGRLYEPSYFWQKSQRATNPALQPDAS